LPLDTELKGTAVQFLRNSPISEQEHFRLYETASSGSHSWIIAMDRGNNEFEALIFFSKSGNDMFKGVHLRGKSARDYSESVLPRYQVGRANVQNEMLIPIYSKQQIDDVIAEKRIFRDNLRKVVRGTVTEGPESTFQRKREQLKNTKTTLRATHIVRDRLGIEKMGDQQFVDWINENSVRAKKGLDVSRIMIVSPELEYDPLLVRILNEMQDNNITVLVCHLDQVEKLAADFCIFDDSHVNSYLSRDKREARHIEDQDTVNDYIELYEIIKEYAWPHGSKRKTGTVAP
jgi:hypothetical protein